MKIWVINKKTGAMLLAIVFIFTAFIITGRNKAVTVANSKRDLPIYCVDKGDEKIVAMSFDAAWGNGRYRILIL